MSPRKRKEIKKTDDEKAEEEHVRNQRGNEKAGDAQAKVYASKPQSEKPEATKRPKSQVDVGELDNSVTRLRNKSMQCPSFNLQIQSLDEFDQKDKLFQMMSKSMEYNKHPTHKALYDTLAVSLSVDEDDMDKELEELPKKKRKDSDAPSSKKTKDYPTSSKKGTTPSKPSKPNKCVQTEETVKKLDQEVAINDEEPVVDEVVNDGEHPHDDDTPSQDRSKWFKQSPRPETFDPNWHKEPNADDMLMMDQNKCGSMI
ncbi:hypothetical protein Tco_0784617 [Tanacetum coccineum]